MSIQKIEPGMPESQSADILADNLARLKGLFPELVTEGATNGRTGPAINIDVLKALVGDATVTDADEKYGLNWHGKRAARQLALTPSTGTLRPCPEESVDWDTTQNLMIEGDNLEVLKLLQKSYAGKVKLIYIDPPYNTGKDFVYPDNFHDNIQNYLQLTGQVEGGRKISSNTEASGRFHTDWLNMISPRLALARNLLSPDGVIFISMDEGEVANLRKVCDEVFGEENYIATIAWEKRTNRENRKSVSSRYDNIIVFCKDKSFISDAIGQLPMSEKALANYKNPDNDPRGLWKSDPATAQAGHGTKSQFYTFVAPNGMKHELESGRCWLYTQSVMQQAADDGRLWFGRDGNGVPRIKTYLEAKDRGLTPETIWFAEDVGTNESAKNVLKEIFDGAAVFDSPKPVELIRQMLLMATRKDSIVLDFFAGSGATGHAVMLQNAMDGGKRRFILVQLPEPCPEESEAKAKGFATISEITENRLKRSAEIVRNSQDATFDGGFRKYYLASSNIRRWNSAPSTLESSLLDHIEHLVENRTTEDLLAELLLKLGLDLCVDIQVREVAGKTVHSIGSGVLVACFDERISVADAELLALGLVSWHKEQTPAGEVTCVFLDSAFENDVAKTNLAAILEQHGIAKVRSL
ncbi:site-specific DNA-methyltransferase [Roseateles sp. BYS96W]|uniref:site-specific DNA-methyltransferase (adenine-specific) n=1 Tax=Pelomonas nitida TaxID=3299027 RepID=A0ABW7G1Q1_9BURK